MLVGNPETPGGGCLEANWDVGLKDAGVALLMVKYNVEIRMNAWCCPCGSDDDHHKDRFYQPWKVRKLPDRIPTYIGKDVF